MSKYYIINQNTAMIRGEFDDHGNCISSVLECGKLMKVKQSPREILNQSLQYHGTCLQSAARATKLALGNIQMPPVKISRSLNMYWLMIYSAEREDNCLLALDHIDHNEKSSQHPDKTLVHFKDGGSTLIDISITRFENRVNNTRKLKSIFDNRAKNDGILNRRYMIVKESNGRYYRKEKSPPSGSGGNRSRLPDRIDREYNDI